MSRLMIVDDEGDRQEMIREAAVQAGFSEDEIVSCMSVHEAMDALHNQHFDVAVIDIRLDNSFEEGGIAVIRALRSRQRDCKIIAVTRREGNDSGVRALANGADDFIGRWQTIDCEDLLIEKLGIYKALVEDQNFPEFNFSGV